MRTSRPERSGASSLRLVVGSDLREVAKARRFVEEVDPAGELREGRLFDLRVAVSEAASNALQLESGGVEIE